LVPSPGGLCNQKAATKRPDPVGEADQSRPATDFSAAVSIVANADAQHV
jgi:hypothetical protein